MPELYFDTYKNYPQQDSVAPYHLKKSPKKKRKEIVPKNNSQ